MRTPDRTPAEWLALLRKGDGAGLIPVAAARALIVTGDIRPISDETLVRSEKRGTGHVMARVA